MDVLSAAIKILEKAGVPLHVTDLTRMMIDEGLWNTKGKTPKDTVGARLYTDIKKYGEKSVFEKAGPQTFRLRGSGVIPPSLNLSFSVTDSAQKVLNESGGKKPMLNRVPLSPKPSFSFSDCAQKVLNEFGGKKPMHYRDITDKALERGWLVTSGKTPEASMYAQVISEIKRHQKRGEQPRFVQYGRGYIGLSQWMGRGLTFQIDQHNLQIRKKLRERLLDIKPSEFEELVSQLLVEMGFDMVEVTKLSGDGGIDVRGTLVVGDVVRIQMAVQVKRWKLRSNVQVLLPAILVPVPSKRRLSLTRLPSL